MSAVQAPCHVQALQGNTRAYRCLGGPDFDFWLLALSAAVNVVVYLQPAGLGLDFIPSIRQGCLNPSLVLKVGLTQVWL